MSTAYKLGYRAAMADKAHSYRNDSLWDDETDYGRGYRDGWREAR